jgi:hypothetical protein
MQQQESSLCLTAVNAEVQRCGYGKWEKSILSWGFEDGHDKVLEGARLDHPGPVLVCISFVSNGFNPFLP